MKATSQGKPSGPVIVSGSARAEEVAAVVAVLAALGGGQATEATRPRSGWADHGRAVRAGLPHGQGAWRASGRPH